MLRRVADEAGASPAQTALAWTLARPGVASVLIGARTPEQLAGNVASLDVLLTPEQTAALDAASAASVSVLAFTWAGLRSAVFGGAPV